MSAEAEVFAPGPDHWRTRVAELQRSHRAVADVLVAAWPMDGANLNALGLAAKAICEALKAETAAAVAAETQRCAALVRGNYGWRADTQAYCDDLGDMLLGVPTGEDAPDWNGASEATR